MGDSMHSDDGFNPFAPGDPPRDETLGALLRRATGDVPMGSVDWDALAARISRALPSRASATWWSYADRWSRRMLPLALAASLVGALALWMSDAPEGVLVAQVASTDVLAEVVQGAPLEDVARTYARSVTADVSVSGSESE